MIPEGGGATWRDAIRLRFLQIDTSGGSMSAASNPLPQAEPTVQTPSQPL
jgi:hypothetical protein